MNIKGTGWQKLRLSILLRDGWTCQMCGTILAEGRRKRNAAVVDHIRPRSLRPDLAADPDNLRSVCKWCHDTVCASIEAQHSTDDAIAEAKLAHRPVGVDGYPVTP